MRAATLHRLSRLSLWLALDLLVATALLVFSAWGDTAGKIRGVPAGGCYCGCGPSKTAAGCGKMCDLPKYASRWWAVTCAKPHVSAPAETPDAGPHLSHPSRSERASN